MANLVLCGFEWGTCREASQWSYAISDSSITTQYARSGKYSCQISLYSHLYFSIPYVGYTGLPEIYIQCACLFDDSIYGFGGVFMQWKGHQGNDVLGQLVLGANGQVLVYCGGQLRVASKTRCISKTWYVFELYIKTDAHSGIITFKIDGNQEGIYSGDTSAGNTYGPDQLDFVYFNGMWLDDVVVNDSDWPGCQKIVLLRPNANGELVEWNKTNDYDNYEHVNEVPPSATDYVYTVTTDKTDIYKLERLPEEAYEIATLRSDAWAIKNSASISQNANVAFALKNGVTTTSSVFVSTTQNLSLTWNLTHYSWDLVNPDTGYNWTVDDVNIIQSGVVSK
jgi:hypothetical protein